MDITLVFFIYGLAFFSMGVALMLEAGRSPLLAEARILIPLAVFGFVHGTHEWVEMFLNRTDWLTFRNPDIISWMRIIFLSVSFSALILFGLSILRPINEVKKRDIFIGICGVCAYGMLVILFGRWISNQQNDSIMHIDVMLRYFLGVVGAVLAGLALLRRANHEKDGNRSLLSGSLKWAGAGFIIYAFSQTVVPPIDVFPASFWNTSNFTRLTGVPIQVIRAFVAVWVTVSMLRAIQFTERERQRELLEAQQARLDALERIRQEMSHREAMRQELLRHIVIAQEEERSRIARELHDETAQILTAFSLSLATLKNAVSGIPDAEKRVDYILKLNHQISTGIYNLVRDLRPVQLDDLGLGAALQYLANEAKNLMGICIQLSIQGDRRKLDSLVDTVLFRVAQEAINNVARHSGEVEADIELVYCPGQVSLRISDAGKGFDPLERVVPPRGWGIAGMRERAESVGGSFNLSSAPGAGTQIEVCVPFTNADEVIGNTDR